MAQHVQERSPSVYILNSTVQTRQHHHHHHQHQQKKRISSPYSSNIYYPYYDQQQLQRRRSSPKMSKLAHDSVLQSYYQNFHDAHPIMLPLSDLNGPLAQRIPTHVLDIMRYIGKHYPTHPPEAHPQVNFISHKFSALTSSSTDQQEQQDGFHVQSLLLLAICAHAHDKCSLATTIMEKAVELALRLGMQHDFACQSMAHDSPEMLEMWRRTYWELYVVAALLSGRRGKVSSLHDTESDVILPCDEILYDKKKPPPQRYTFQDLCQNWPQGIALEAVLPSFGYRVDAAYLLGCVLSHGPYMSPNASRDSDMNAIDTALTEWQRRCVHRKDMSTPANSNHFEEMILQAQFIAHSATIYLYQPKTNLMPIPIQTEEPGCTDIFPPSFITFSKPSSSPSFPTIVTDPSLTPLLGAANSIAYLLTMLGPHPDRHSPFLINGISLQVLVQMAARRSIVVAGNDDGRSASSKERMEYQIGNALGVLARLQKKWPLAKVVRDKLKKAYQGYR